VREEAAQYILAMMKFRDEVMAVQTDDAIPGFMLEYVSNPYAQAAVLTREVRKLALQLDRLKTECARSGFPHTKPRAKGKRKPGFKPPLLDRIERDGPNYRAEGIFRMTGGNVTPDIWQKCFSFRGVEFGNWLSQKDRQQSMNCCFDALKDLAVELGIEDEDVSFSGKLALAFGARGKASSSAHYEPLREVINLTKLHGAGCTAHEWFHALDDVLAKSCGIEGKLASECNSGDWDKLPKSFVQLIRLLQHDEKGRMTDFYRGSRKFDNHFAKDSHGSWASKTEMAARAFACYVKDCHGGKSDYLIAHADAYELEYENQFICAIPQGEERELFNELFDQLIYELKDMGFFHERSEKSDVTVQLAPKPIPASTVDEEAEEYTMQLQEVSCGQLSFAF
jgi:hypothetical protein